MLCVLDTDNSCSYAVSGSPLLIDWCCSEETWDSLSSELFPAVLLFVCLHLGFWVLSRDGFLSSLSPAHSLGPGVLLVATWLL